MKKICDIVYRLLPLSISSTPTSHLNLTVATLLYGLPNSCILKLQRTQNSAARIIYRRKKFDHVTPLLKELHWLAIRQRIQYKLLLLCFKAHHGLAASYLQYCIIPYSPCRPLRTKHLLVVPPTKLKTYGDRSFNKAAPLLWNNYHITYGAVTNLINLSICSISHTCRDAMIFSP